MYNCSFKYFVCLSVEVLVDVVVVVVEVLVEVYDVQDFVEDGARDGGRDVDDDEIVEFVRYEPVVCVEIEFVGMELYRSGSDFSWPIF